jgi:hypothetical protein
MLQLWWHITGQTYLYYWHHDVWGVLGAFTLLILLVALVSEEIWRAGYKAALRSMGDVQDEASSSEKRRFLAPSSQAFPGLRRLVFSSGKRSGRSTV